MARTKTEDQLGMDEHVIDDPSIESALEEREKRKNSLNAVRKNYDAAHTIASAKISELELPEGGAVRVGRFRITRQEVAAGHREFDTKASSRVRISLVKEGAIAAAETDAPDVGGQEPIENYRRPTAVDSDQPPAVH